MDEWNLEVINTYCEEHFGDKFQCVLAEGKGRIMMSKYAIKQGDLLFIEPPLHLVLEDHKNQAFKTVQRLCKKSPAVFDYEPLWYWTALCSLTAAQVGKGPKVGSLPPIGEQHQQRLLALYHTPVTEASEAVFDIVKALGLANDLAVVLEDLLQAWILNCFEHSEDPLGYSAYFASSFVSHSCGPNAIWSEGDNGDHILRARRDIAAGDEVTISYLEEHVLLHSADTRIASLESTKLFKCTCERCDPAPGMKCAAVGDTCRMFRCPGCNACAVLYKLGTENKMGLNDVSCSVCGREVTTTEARRLLQVETALEARIDKLDKEIARRAITEVLPEGQAESLLKAVTDEASPVGPQHWLVDRALEHLDTWYKAKGRRADARRMMQLRAEYMAKAYPGLSGTLAWTLEAQAAVLLSHLGFEDARPGSRGRAPEGMDAEEQDRVAASTNAAFEEAGRILTLMFGIEHEYTTSLIAKYEEARKFLDDRSRWATPLPKELD